MNMPTKSIDLPLPTVEVVHQIKIDPDLRTAFELRAMGITIPESIPDCATIPRSAISIKVAVDQTLTPDKDSLSMGFDVKFLAPFQWVSATFIVNKGIETGPGHEKATDA